MLRHTVTIAPKILAAPNQRSLGTCLVGAPQTQISGQGRDFYLSPLAVRKVSTPLLTTFCFNPVAPVSQNLHQDQNI